MVRSRLSKLKGLIRNCILMAGYCSRYLRIRQIERRLRNLEQQELCSADLMRQEELASSKVTTSASKTELPSCSKNPPSSQDTLRYVRDQANLIGLFNAINCCPIQVSVAFIEQMTSMYGAAYTRAILDAACDNLGIVQHPVTWRKANVSRRSGA